MRKLTFLFLGLFFAASVLAQEGTERIHNFDTSVEIKKSGVIQVREEISYDFGSNYRHGIYRDIPQIVYRENNKKYVLEYSNISVTDEKGDSHRYSLLYPQDYLRIKIGDPDKTITGTHTYVVSYEVSGALTYFNDHTELFWNSTGDQWYYPIDAAKTTLTLPSEISGENLKVACYTGSLGSNASECNFSTIGNTVVFNAQRGFYAKEGMSTVLGFPNGIVQKLLAEEYVPFNERWYGRLLIGLVIMLALLWYLVYPIWIVIKWFRYGRDPKSVVGETRSWYDSPTTSSGRKLTPIETGSLLDEKVDNRDVSAMIVDLARRGYMKIEERGKKNFFLLRKHSSKKDDSLMSFEKSFLDQVFGSVEEVKVKDSKLYTIIESIKTQVYKQMVSDGFFAKDPSRTRVFYAVIAVFGLATFNIQLALVAILFGLHMARKTELGAGAAAVGRSLKNFLSSQERQLTFQANKQIMFERLLPFAVAYGVEKIWADRFKDINLKQPTWYSSTHVGAFNSAVFMSSLDSSLKSVSVASQPTRSSSGSGFSGGFSGGGGGGGGGGSW